VWQALYDSPLHHPGLAWLALVVSAFALASRQRFLFGFLVVFGLEMAADALASSPFVKIPGALGSAVAVAFVVAGDLRLFVVTERCAEARGLSPAAVARAVGLSLVVPVASSVVRALSANVAATPRLQYLVYEALFVGAALVYRATLSRRLATAAPARRRWALRLVELVLVQYLLWATCDVLVLVGFAPALAVRILPNIMYYALFLPAVYLWAPAEERDASRGSSA